MYKSVLILIYSKTNIELYVLIIFFATDRVSSSRLFSERI